MSSTDHNRPISSSIPLPQWMKNKMSDRYDINEPFSPPQQDDDFFYIRYPRSQQASVPPVAPRITTAAPALRHLEQEKRVRSMAMMGPLSNHTEPCRPFIGQLPPTHEIEGWTNTGHPPGTDDGFKGTSAQCGQSVVNVAQQIVSKRLGSEEKEDNFETSWEPPAASLRHRRNSKSLPGSPKAQRKLQHQFFTGMFGPGSLESSSGSLTSLLSGFLSNPRNEMETVKSSSTSKMRRNQSLSVISDNLEPKYESPNNQPASSLHAKASEFREMNFISPTSF